MASRQNKDTGSSSKQHSDKHKTCSSIKARVQEKEELLDLNDRLAAYIDRVRSLESQNAKLAAEVTQANEARVREVSNIKAMYEAELAEARRLLDDTAKEKAQLKLENNKLNGILADLRPKLEHEMSANKRLTVKLRGVERSLAEKESLLAVYANEKLELEKRVAELERQMSELEAELAKHKDLLEKEIIARIDAENRYQTLKEEAQFNASLYQKELSDARRAQSSTVVDDTDYEGMLQLKLQELREEFECEAAGGKQELEDAYRMKLEHMKEQAERDRLHISKLMAKQADLYRIIEELKAEKNALLAKLEQAQKRLVELEGLRPKDKEDFKIQLEDREAKNRKLQAAYERLEAEYQSLLGIKIQLDMELAAYNKLLEGEEQHFNIQSSSSKSSTSVSSSSRVSRKRGRSSMGSAAPSVECSATGEISIGDVDLNGTFVTIANNGTDNAELGGFIVQRVVDGKDATGFTFPCHYTLMAQQTVTIWSHSQGKKANPPKDYVLEGDWSVDGNSVATVVLNTEAEVVAGHTITVNEMMMRSGGKKCTSDTCSTM